MTKTNSRTDLFETVPVPRAIMTLAIPSVISMLVMMIYNLADTYFVGMLNDPIQNAAVTLAAPILLAFNAVNNLFGVGSSSMMSRALGRHDIDTVKKSSAFGFYCAVFSGIIFAIACTVFKSPLMALLGTSAENREVTGEYMFWTVTCGATPSIVNVVMGYLVKAEGSALHASIGTMSGCVLNIILDPIFILPWGLNMGAAGAGCATFISNCVAVLYFLVLLFVRKNRTMVSINPRHVSFSRAIVVGVCAVGIPAAIQNLLNVTGMTILNNFTASYGSSEAVAAMGIAQKLHQIPTNIVLGISQGIMPLTSYNFAAKNYPRMKKVIVFTFEISLIFIVVITVGFCLFADNLIALFMKNDVIIAYGERFLRGLALAMPFLTTDFITVGVFQSCGMGTKALLFAVLRKIVLEIPAIILLNKLFGIYGLAYSQLIAEFILAIASLIVLIRMFRGLVKDAPDTISGGSRLG